MLKEIFYFLTPKDDGMQHIFLYIHSCVKIYWIQILSLWITSDLMQIENMI